MIATGWTLRRTGSLVERNALIYRRSLTPVLSSIVEPVLYLLSIGFGVGTLVGKVAGVDVRYAAFVAPGDPGHHRDERGLQPDELRRLHRGSRRSAPTTRSCRRRCRLRTSRSVRSPALCSAGVFAAVGFVVVMLVLGLVVSPGILLAIPGALLVGYAFAAAGLAVTTYMRDFSDFQLIQLVMLPMFLFATTFYPLSVYPSWVRPIIEILPLYQSIQLLREPALGIFHWDLLVAVLYLVAFGSLALALATRRLTRQLLP